MSFDGSQQGFAMAPQALGCAKKKAKRAARGLPFRNRSDRQCRCRLLFDGDDDAGTDGAAAFT
ncbi:hypothetical protein, partial [Mesorhizobium sp.]|uniref:hypothetical protein n=1 Tax=Mesorhizobium sp. TaxID=1871066 RepID=UPI00257ED1AA